MVNLNNNVCGKGDLGITGCRMLIAPMCDDFVNIILDSIENTYITNVWKYTDSLGTLLRGKQTNVVSVAKNIFLNAYRKDVHMTASLTFSKGCPGDVEADYLKDSEELLELQAHINDCVQCEATISFYSFGNNEYMAHIYNVIDLFKEMGVYSDKSHYSTIIKGSVKEIFEAYNTALNYGFNNLNHYVVETNLSINSPSKNKKGETI